MAGGQPRRVNTMANKLTDTQLSMLTGASLRDDRCLALPRNLRGSAAQKVASKLAVEGLVKEIIAKAGAPVWRRDEQAGRSYSLKLTAAGLKAARAEVDSGRVVEDIVETPATSKVAQDPLIARDNIPAPTSAATLTATDSNPPRGGTKIAKVLGLLRRNEGATLAEMIVATDWLPHTTRAALTGLRKRGYAISIDRSNKQRGSIYRAAGAAKPEETEADARTAAEDNVISPARRAKRAGAAPASHTRKAA